MAKELNCENFDLAAFVDGELDAHADLAIEAHLGACPSCRLELNAQKQFLRMLETSLRKPEAEMELPRDFSKRIITTAENNVVGLRSWKERFNAVFIIASLLIFSLFVLGAEGADLVATSGALVQKLAAVGAFATQMAYSFLMGVVVLVRSLVRILNPADGVLATLGVFGVVSLFVLGLKFVPFRKLLRPLF